MVNATLCYEFIYHKFSLDCNSQINDRVEVLST